MSWNGRIVNGRPAVTAPVITVVGVLFSSTSSSPSSSSSSSSSYPSTRPLYCRASLSISVHTRTHNMYLFKWETFRSIVRRRLLRLQYATEPPRTVYTAAARSSWSRNKQTDEPLEIHAGIGRAPAASASATARVRRHRRVLAAGAAVAGHDRPRVVAIHGQLPLARAAPVHAHFPASTFSLSTATPVQPVRRNKNKRDARTASDERLSTTPRSTTPTRASAPLCDRCIRASPPRARRLLL